MGALIWLAALMVARGGTLSVLWSWFVAGAGAPFEGQAPHLNVGEALGVGVVVTFLTADPQDMGRDPKDPTERAGNVLVFYLAIWVIALIARLVTA